MPAPGARLRLVPPASHRPAPGCASDGDLGLLAFLLAVALVPVVGSLSGGPWHVGTVGVATVGSVLCIRELGAELRARARTRR